MLRQARILGVLCAPAVACAALAFSPAAAMADTTIIGSPTVTGVTQVGQTLTCDTTLLTLNDPGTDGTPDYTDYTWYQDSTSGTQVADGPSDTTYTPVAGDIGHALVCKVTANDGTGSDATAASAGSSAIAPVPSVAITQFSPTVSGNIGEDVAGVTVTVTLKREDQDQSYHTVATGSKIANSTDGSWSVQLSGAQPVAFGAQGDEVDVSYSSTGATLPPNGTYGGTNTPYDFFVGDQGTISPDGTRVTLPHDVPPGCIGESVVVDGGSPQATTFDGTGCQVSGQSLTDEDQVQGLEASTITAGDGTTSNLTTVSNLGLVGVGNGSEIDGAGVTACTADLVSGQVTCYGLGTGTFFANDIQLSKIRTNGGGSYNVYEGQAFLTGLTAGGTVSLTEQGVTRTLATLHLGTLRVDIDSDGNVTGSCKANESLSNGGPYPALCSTGGAIPDGYSRRHSPDRGRRFQRRRHDPQRAQRQQPDPDLRRLDPGRVHRLRRHLRHRLAVAAAQPGRVAEPERHPAQRRLAGVQPGTRRWPATTPGRSPTWPSRR